VAKSPVLKASSDSGRMPMIDVINPVLPGFIDA
jgi:hypothetical protein